MWYSRRTLSRPNLSVPTAAAAVILWVQVYIILSYNESCFIFAQHEGVEGEQVGALWAILASRGVREGDVLVEVLGDHEYNDISIMMENMQDRARWSVFFVCHYSLQVSRSGGTTCLADV